ncbi:MAG: ATP synthase F0 subunit C [Candidatus Hydrogenedentes bacterium]|nr:ATP synthase F0 subunit C [Candidatus Hydrogenedentota bacterium]
MFELEPHTWQMLGRYIGAGVALGFGGIGAAIGMGYAAGQAQTGMMRQPKTQGLMLRTMLIGQAVGSSPSIFALVVGLFILFVGVSDPEGSAGNFFAALAGAGFSIGFGAFGSGLGCGWPAGEACEGVARNPRRISQTTQVMIIGQAVAQSPSIFALVISLILILRQHTGTDLGLIGVGMGSGLAIGISALGSGMGSGRTAGGATHGCSNWPRAYGLTVRTMLIGQAVCETPAIFGMLVAFIMMFAMPSLEGSIVGFAQVFGAGIAVGLGGVGPGLGSGLTGSSGCLATATRPDKEPLILRTMLIGQAVSQSTAIYALIIALLLLYVM